MNKHSVSSGAERAAAAKDRAEWLNWKPSRGGQMAIALVEAVVRSHNNGTIEKRVAQNVRTMR